MQDVQITILDPDTTLANQAGKRLRALLQQESIHACVQEVTCYLEISRQGLTGKTPVIAVNNQNFQCKNLSDELLEQFSHWLATTYLPKSK
ncbi:MAG: hypothetical protein MI749_11190 [Desulfovibrionales bacterium]|nr:hypothetical protein [Desulfovibrionales bacterium]